MRLVGFPLYTYSVVIFAMLASAGLGSFFSERIVGRDGRRFAVPFLGILVTALALRLTHEAVFDAMLAAPMGIRIVAAGLLIAPLGFFLGMPFPLGVRVLERNAPALIPWGWAVNGFCSVLASLLATLLAMQIGFLPVLGVAAAVYAAGLLLAPVPRARSGGTAVNAP